ncbi:hypothetical protein IWW48_006266 [Coemansia sp. RSA 1200]|nr:hypothetical protein IWW48_006266 [Coemansia sp. RSA 1200]
MKLAVAAGLLGFVAVAVAQDSSSSSLSAYEQCLEDKCPSNKNDVSCQASCLSNPNPNASMIAETNKCYEGCNGLDYQGAIDCQKKCNEIYNPSGVIVTDHLTPDGFSNDGSSSTSASTGAESSAHTESQDSESGAESANSSENESSGDHESNSEEEISGEEDTNTDTSDGTETDTSGASGVKAALSAVAAVAAVAALF